MTFIASCLDVGMKLTGANTSYSLYEVSFRYTLHSFSIPSMIGCCSDIKGALSSLLRTFSDDNTGSVEDRDKIGAVAGDGADQRPVSATPSTLGGPRPGRRTKDVGTG